jgi:hypothetical protein
MVLELPVLSIAVAPLLLDEPADIADIREIRHWIRVYSSLLELSVAFPPEEEQTASTRRRLVIWRGRLSFWQGRAREISNPATW